MILPSFRASLAPALAALALFVGPVAVPSVCAATYTWTGNSTVSNNWSDSANWLGGAIPVSDTASAVSFASLGSQAAVNPNSLQNLTTPSPYMLSALSFDFTGSSGAFSLGGNDIAVGNGISVAQNSAYSVAVSNNFPYVAPLPGGMSVSGNGTGAMTLSGAIDTGLSGLTKSGTSSLILTGTGDYNSGSVTGGSVTQSGGRQTYHGSFDGSLVIANGISVGTASYNLSGGTLSSQTLAVGGSSGGSAFNQSGGQYDLIGGLALSGKGSYSLSGNSVLTVRSDLNITSDGMFNQSGGSVGIGGSIGLGAAGVGAVYNLSGGTLNGSNVSLDGNAVLNITNTGNAQIIGSALTLNSTAKVTVSGGGALTTSDLVGTASTVSVALSDPSSTVSALTLTQGSGSVFRGVISDGATGPGGFTKAGIGDWTLSGANTYTGPTRLTRGMLILASTGAIANSALIAISGGATLDVSAKAAPGLVVSSGQTLNNNGTVTGSLDVRGTLSGVGQVSGSVLVESAATLSPGNPYGTMITGNLTLSAGSVLLLELPATLGKDYDSIFVKGTVMLGNGTLNLLQTLPGGTAAGTNFFVIANDGTDAVVGRFLGLAQDGVIVSNGVPFRISYTGDLASGVFEGAGNDVVLQNISVVPEPSVWTLMALLGGAGAAAGLARRARCSRLVG